jgi:hypothetical protein
MNAEALRLWLDAIIQALPHGGKQRAAAQLGITPSGLSKLLSRKGRGFDDKTCRCAAWILQSKAEKFSVETFPVVKEIEVNGIVVELRKAPDGAEFAVWRKK